MGWTRCALPKRFCKSFAPDTRSRSTPLGCNLGGVFRMKSFLSA
jgi:hypothetical protein